MLTLIYKLMATGRNMVSGHSALIPVGNLVFNIASEHVQIRVHNMAVRTVREMSSSKNNPATAKLNVQVNKCSMVDINVF